MAKIMPGEFDSWANRHATMFGMLKPEERDMIRSWRPIFISCGYTFAELRYATEMIARSPPKFRGQHLEQVHTTIGELRKKSIDEEAGAWSAIDTFEACRSCKGYGWVVVPHPRFVSNGEWTPSPGKSYKLTVNVACSCESGRRIAGAHQRKRPMGLEEYESRNPEWRTQVAEYEAGIAAARKARDTTAAVDRSLGSLVAGIAADLDARPHTKRTGADRRPASKRGIESHTEPEQDMVMEEFETAARRSRQRPSKSQLRLFDQDTGTGTDEQITEGLKS